MIEKKYTFKTQEINEWLKNNNDVQVLTLEGTIDEDLFDSLNNVQLPVCIRKIVIGNISFPKTKNDYGYESDYLSHLYSSVYDDSTRLSILNKVLSNSERIKNFIFKDGYVFSEDEKAIVHYPEKSEYIHLEGIEYIGNYACCGYSSMNSVKFNNSLVEIGQLAFACCENIVEINLPDSVRILGDGAFCFTACKKVKLSDNLGTIPYACFYITEIDEIHIPKSVKIIEDEAFVCGYWFGRVVIPEGVESIGYYSFPGLLYMKLPASLKKIAPSFYYEAPVDFEGCPPYIDISPENKTFYSQDGTLYYRDSNKLVLDSPFVRRPLSGYRCYYNDCKYDCNTCDYFKETSKDCPCFGYLSKKSANCPYAGE